jgi:hypothetical protein
MLCGVSESKLTVEVTSLGVAMVARALARHHLEETWIESGIRGGEESVDKEAVRILTGVAADILEGTL